MILERLKCIKHNIERKHSKKYNLSQEELTVQYYKGLNYYFVNTKVEPYLTKWFSESF